ncbi:tetratricopeptide repeat protein [Paraglaciecola sp. L3A3]|uniref:tetratricopeptide repeat protein n=1 Tax=Paraglaciecola sp. L3A3 TaxID=2686358 RepID=UPI00131C6659|nr:tetratricopeptide repeat protein [Paraglaciecola sp. L3A3]
MKVPNLLTCNSLSLPIGIVVLLMTGCQLWSATEEVKAPSTNRIQPASPLFASALEPIKITPSKMGPADLIHLRDTYAKLTPEVQDPKQQQQMRKRLASLEMLLAEQEQEQGLTSDTGYYQQAIQTYLGIQKEEHLGEDGAHISYQLSRAYDLQGNAQASFAELSSLIQTYPTSRYIAEAHFRQGEYLYAKGEFSRAVEAYNQAVTFPNSEYFAMSAYMLGWSQFNLDNQQQAAQAFGKVLDKYLGAESWQFGEPEDEQPLRAGEQRLVNDSVRIMSLIFSYASNEQSLLSFIENIGARRYEHILFDGLAQLQLNNDRFKDSANAYLAFAQRHPTHPLAADFYVKHIDAYILGEFPSLVMPAKQGYVEMFGINGSSWATQPKSIQQKLTPYLRQYLNELAQYEHARAQLLVSRSESNTQQQHIAAFISAARWYQEYIDTFENEKDTIEKRFLLAESLHDGGQILAAITEFERYAYDIPQGNKAADAAYAAILSYRKLLNTSATDTDTSLVTASFASQEKFINTFTTDKRANDIALLLMQTRFTNKEYPVAIELANWLMSRYNNALGKNNSDKTSQIYLSASLVAAHSLFAIQDFTNAEQAYQKVLAQLNTKDKRYVDMQERLAVSIYRQGELAQTNQQLDQAVSLWQRIVTELPNSQVRLNAQYDAATLLLQQQNWSAAIALLTDFASRFEQHPLTQGIADKLIFAYEKNEQWELAADGLYEIWQQTPQQEEGRLALWTAAEYYQKAQLRSKYLPAYRQYAHTYPAPFDTATEVRFLMSEFYLTSNEDSKRRYWLNKLITADKQAGENRTVRSQYLAAKASMVFAKDAVYVFNQIKLTLPLKLSLTKKRQAMDTAIAKFDQVMAYGVAELSSAANYQIAEIFRVFSIDLMTSERPKGLSVLALEQYELLLEEQTYPFEEQAIELHESNVQRSWQGNYDQWVENSINQLSKLLPVRYGKQAITGELANELF